MHATDLMFPGIHGPAQQVRQLVAAVLSQQESVSEFGDVSSDFADFLMDASAKSPGYVAPEAPGPEPMPATKAIVEHQAFTQVLDYRGAKDRKSVV